MSFRRKAGRPCSKSEVTEMGEELSDAEEETACERGEAAMSEGSTPPSLSGATASPHLLGQGSGMGVGLSGQHIAVPPDLYADLKALSDATQLNPAELMRRLLQDYHRTPVSDNRQSNSVATASPIHGQPEGDVSSDILDLQPGSRSRSYGDLARDSQYHTVVRSAVSSPVYRGSPEVDVVSRDAMDLDQPLDLSMVKQEVPSPKSTPPNPHSPLVLSTSVGASHLYTQASVRRVTLRSNLPPLTSLPGTSEGKVMLMPMQLPKVPVVESRLSDSKKVQNRQQEAQELLLQRQQQQHQQLLQQQDEQQQQQQHDDLDHELQQVFYEHSQHHHRQMQLQKQKLEQQQQQQQQPHQQQQRQEYEQLKHIEHHNQQQQQQQLDCQMQQQKQQLLHLQQQYNFTHQMFSSPSASPLPPVASTTSQPQAVQLTPFPMVTTGMAFPLPVATCGLSFSLPVSLTMASPATAAPTTLSMLSTGNILAIPVIQTLPDSNPASTCVPSIQPPPPPTRPPPSAPTPLPSSHASIAPAPTRPSAQQSSARSSRGRGGGRGGAKNFKAGGEMKVLAENTSFPGVYTSILKLPWSRRSRAKGDGSRGIHRHLMLSRKSQSKGQEVQEQQQQARTHSERAPSQISEGEETTKEKETREKLRQIQYEEHQLQIKLQQEQMLQQLLHEQQQQLQQKLQQDIKEKSMLQLQKQQQMQQRIVQQQQQSNQPQQQGKQTFLQEQPEGQQDEGKDSGAVASLVTPSTLSSSPQVMFLPISQVPQQALASLVPVSAQFSSSITTSTSTASSISSSSSSISAESLMMVYPSAAMSTQGKAVRRRGRPPKLPVLYHLLTESAKSQRSEVREHASSTGIPLVQTQSLGSSGATLSLMHMNVQSCVPSLPFALGPCMKTEAAGDVMQQAEEGRQRQEELLSLHKAGSEEELGEIRSGLPAPKRESKEVMTGSSITPAVTSEGGLFHEMLLSSSSLVNVKPRRRQPSDVTLKAGDNFICTSFRIRPRGGKQGRGRVQSSRGSAAKAEADDPVDIDDCAGVANSVDVETMAQDRKMEGRCHVTEAGAHAPIDPGNMFQELYHCRICNEIVQAEAKVEHLISHSLERCDACFSCGVPLQPVGSAEDASTETSGPRFCHQCASQISRTGFPAPSCSLGSSTECEVCKLDLEDKLSLAEHYQAQHPELAPARSAKRRRLDAAESRRSQATPMRSPGREVCFICPEDECPRVFFDEAKLAKHMKRDHGRGDKDKCNDNQDNEKKTPKFGAFDDVKESGDNVSDKNDVDEGTTAGSPSSSSNVDSNALRCDWPGCSVDFDSEQALKVHLAMHREEKPLKCEFCDYRCRQQNALNWHMRKHPEAPSKYRKYTVLAGGDT